MPRYRILISRRADKFLYSLQIELRRRILEEITDFENFPFLITHHDLAKLRGKEGYYRLRVGEVRVILKIDKKTRTVIVEKISYRERAYE